MNYYVGLGVCLKETSVCVGSNPDRPKRRVQAKLREGRSGRLCPT
jgi:hypothetical protein